MTHPSSEKQMPPEEWKRLFANRIIVCANWSEKAAIELAAQSYRFMVEECCDFANAPEDAADEEMSNWGE